jgi:hypothetical protein
MKTSDVAVCLVSASLGAIFISLNIWGVATFLMIAAIVLAISFTGDEIISAIEKTKK